MCPLKSFLDKLNRNKLVKFPKDLGITPLNSFWSSIILLRLEALGKLCGRFPPSLFSDKNKVVRLGRALPIFEGRRPERKLGPSSNSTNVDMLKILEGIGPLR